MMMIRMAMKATTPPTIPIINVSSLLIGCLICGSFLLIFADWVMGTLQMMSGSAVVGRVRILDEGFGGDGGRVGTVSSSVVADVVAFLGLQVSSSSPTSIKSFP